MLCHACVCFSFAGSLLLTGAMSFLTSSELLGLETDLWCGYHTAWVVSALPVQDKVSAVILQDMLLTELNLKCSYSK